MYRLARKCLQRQRSNELSSAAGHDDFHAGTSFTEQAHKLSRLVSCNPAADSDDDISIK